MVKGCCGLVLLGGGLLVAPAQANPADGFGFGSRSVAMAGAVSADVSDYSANYYNPSGLVAADHFSLTLGGVHNAHYLKIADSASSLDPVRGFTGGLVVPGDIAEVPFAFGLATQMAGNQLSRVVTLTGDEPVWALYETRGRQIYISANVAIRPIEWLSVGMGVAYLAATRGGFSVEGTAIQPVGMDSEYDSKLRHEIVADLRPVRSLQFGVTVQPAPDWSAALVFRDEAAVRLDFDAELVGLVELGPLSIPARYVLESQNVNAFGPRQLVGGISKQFGALTLNLDVAWVQWSRYQDPFSRSTSEVEVDAPPELLSIPGAPDASQVPRVVLSDRWVPRIGFEYTLALSRRWSLPLRSGYAFEKSPVVNSTSTVFVDADRHTFAVGTGIARHRREGRAFADAYGLNAHAQWSLLSALAHRDPTGRGMLLGFGVDLWLSLE